MPVCAVCLEEGADEAPPCGGAQGGLQFHGACLRRVKRVQGARFRCPHCNLPVAGVAGGGGGACEVLGEAGEAGRAARVVVRAVLEDWLVERGFWAHGAVYVYASNALIRGAEEGAVQGAIRAEVCGMLEGATGCDVVASAGEAGQAELQVFRAGAHGEGEQTTVCVGRRAYVVGGGRIVLDGFTLSGRRVRCSPRA